MSGKIGVLLKCVSFFWLPSLASTVLPITDKDDLCEFLLLLVRPLVAFLFSFSFLSFFFFLFFSSSFSPISPDLWAVTRSQHHHGNKQQCFFHTFCGKKKKTILIFLSFLIFFSLQTFLRDWISALVFSFVTTVCSLAASFQLSFLSFFFLSSLYVRTHLCIPPTHSLSVLCFLSKCEKKSYIRKKKESFSWKV